MSHKTFTVAQPSVMGLGLCVHVRVCGMSLLSKCGGKSRLFCGLQGAQVCLVLKDFELHSVHTS